MLSSSLASKAWTNDNSFLIVKHLNLIDGNTVSVFDIQYGQYAFDSSVVSMQKYWLGQDLNLNPCELLKFAKVTSRHVKS